MRSFALGQAFSFLAMADYEAFPISSVMLFQGEQSLRSLNRRSPSPIIAPTGATSSAARSARWDDRLVTHRSRPPPPNAAAIQPAAVAADFHCLRHRLSNLVSVAV